MKKLWMQEVMRNTDLSIGARILWWELAQWTTPELPECYRQQCDLVTALGASRASVIRWTKELAEAGLLAADRTQRGNRYTLKTGPSSALVSA